MSWSSVPASTSLPDLDGEPDRPAFLDWFRSPAPASPPEPPLPSDQPAADAAVTAEPTAEHVLDEPVPGEHTSGESGPPDEPVLADTADSYSWSPYETSPPVMAAATAPIPKFTPVTWAVVVTSDREYYDLMQAERIQAGWDLPFPAYHAERRFPLTGQQVRIGRRSAARAVEPEIDLSGAPVDPGISRLHLMLLPAPDGSWAVLDPGSANGTLLNGREVPAGDLIPLRDGDRINLGAWTVITVRRE
jgi:FHA domain